MAKSRSQAIVDHFKAKGITFGSSEQEMLSLVQGALRATTRNVELKEVVGVPVSSDYHSTGRSQYPKASLLLEKGLLTIRTKQSRKPFYVEGKLLFSDILTHAGHHWRLVELEAVTESALYNDLEAFCGYQSRVFMLEGSRSTDYWYFAKNEFKPVPDKDKARIRHLLS